MAMSGRGQREATKAIASCRAFTNSTRSLRGTKGPTQELGWLSGHRHAARIKRLLASAVYVVWSYQTPIGFVTEEEDGNITKWYIDESHSVSTSHHQTLVRVGFSDFETIGEGPWSGSTRRRAPRGPVSEQEWLDHGSLGARAEAELDRDNLPPGADERDQARVYSTSGYRHPAHP
jgi:hypothetical protein